MGPKAHSKNSDLVPHMIYVLFRGLSRAFSDAGQFPLLVCFDMLAVARIAALAKRLGCVAKIVAYQLQQQAQASQSVASRGAPEL